VFLTLSHLHTTIPRVPITGRRTKKVFDTYFKPLIGEFQKKRCIAAMRWYIWKVRLCM